MLLTDRQDNYDFEIGNRKQRSNRLKNVFLLHGVYKKTFFYLLAYSILFIFPIILANVYYIDDVGRLMNGIATWQHDGRPLMYMIANVFSNGKLLMPVFPVPMFLAVVLLSYILVVYAKKYFPHGSAFTLSICLGISFCNLFLVENFSYIFESFGMIFSLSIFIGLFVICEDLKNKRNIAISVFLCVCSLSTYQAALGGYIGLAAIEAGRMIFQSRKYKDIIWQVVMRGILLCAGMVIYKLVIANQFIKGYADVHGEIVNVLSISGIHTMKLNLVIFLHTFKDFFISLGTGPSLIITGLIVLGTFLICKDFCKSQSYGKKWKVIGCAYFVFLPSFLMFSSIFPYLFLAHPVFASRVFLSVTIFTLYIGFLMLYVGKRSKYVYVCGLFLLLSNCTFSATYGTVLNREYQHEQQMAYFIVNDINHIENQTNKKYGKITFVGKAPRSYELQLTEKHKPLLRMLVPVYYSGDWFWGGKYIQHYRTMVVKSAKLTNDDKKMIESTQPSRKNEFYGMYANGDKIIVVFPSVN